MRQGREMGALVWRPSASFYPGEAQDVFVQGRGIFPVLKENVSYPAAYLAN